jgi:hypothetical protein
VLFYKNILFEFFPKEVGDFDFIGSPVYTLWELFEER